MTDKNNSQTPTAPVGVWFATGTRLGEPYPCRCHERKYEQCSAVFCPCAGRKDPQNADCCANRYGPAQVVQASIAYRIKKMQRGG